METTSPIGASFTHWCLSKKTYHTWIVTKQNKETNYVYVERDDVNGKVGQWIPAEWLAEFGEISKMRKKNDALRKSRDYFRNERDDLNLRISTLSVNLTTRAEVLSQELGFVRSELSISEKDISFWRSMWIYTIAATIALFASLVMLGAFEC